MKIVRENVRRKIIKSWKSESFKINEYFRSDAEVQEPRENRNDRETKSALIGISGFVLSVFFILWALIILVRFYIFDSILYNVFLFCMLLTGIGFNIASINLLLTDSTDFSYLLPFVFGSPVSLFWTILCIIIPIYKKDFFSQFSFMPIAIYDTSFYDGIGYNPNDTSIHPFAKPFTTENSIFNSTSSILIILVMLARKLRNSHIDLDIFKLNKKFCFFSRTNVFLALFDCILSTVESRRETFDKTS